MSTFITIIHIVTCILLVLVVMIQSGKGAEISASFGGSSQTVFGSSGGANFFVKFTGVAAAIFMATSLGLTVMAGRANRSLFEGVAVPATSPANPVGAPIQPAPVDAQTGNSPSARTADGHRATVPSTAGAPTAATPAGKDAVKAGAPADAAGKEDGAAQDAADEDAPAAASDAKKAQ